MVRGEGLACRWEMFVDQRPWLTWGHISTAVRHSFRGPIARVQAPAPRGPRPRRSCFLRAVQAVCPEQSCRWPLQRCRVLGEGCRRCVACTCEAQCVNLVLCLV